MAQWARRVGWVLVCWAAMGAQAKTLRVCMTDVPHAPWRVAEEDGRVKGRGLDFELLQDFQRLSAWTVELQVLSGRRCLVEIAAGRSDATVGLSHTAERAQQFRYPMHQGQADSRLALRQDAYSLYRRRDSSVVWDGARLNLKPGAVVLVQAGHSIAARLRQAGAPVTEAERSAYMTLFKLSTGEVDAAAVFTSEGQALLQAHPQFANLEALRPVLAQKHYYVVFGESFARQHEGELPALWRSFLKAAQAPDYATAVRRAKTGGKR
jgi:polar amino acid transport system substrate-binding protein